MIHWSRLNAALMWLGKECRLTNGSLAAKRNNIYVATPSLSRTILYFLWLSFIPSKPYSRNPPSRMPSPVAWSGTPAEDRRRPAGQNSSWNSGNKKGYCKSVCWFLAKYLVRGVITHEFYSSPTQPPTLNVSCNICVATLQTKVTMQNCLLGQYFLPIFHSQLWTGSLPGYHGMFDNT